MSEWAKRLNYKIIILFFTVLACVILTVYFASKGETGVYTYFFYIPILLAGVWYHKKAVYIALFLSFFLCISYILVTYPLPHHLPIDTFERSVIFVLVAYVIRLVSEKEAKGEEKLRETKDYLDDIIKSSAGATAIVAMEGIVRSWNKAA